MTEHHDVEEYLTAVRETDGTTKAIADAVGVRRPSADERLRKLADEGHVEKEMIGNSLRWTLADEE